MKLRRYLRSQLVPLTFFVMAIVVTALLLGFFGVSRSVIVAIVVLLLLGVIAAYTWGYAVRRRFYTEIETVLRAEGERYYVTEHLKRPNFAEGKITFDTLAEATKDMNDRIAEHRLAAQEYQEYIETWIHEVKTPIAASRLILENTDTVVMRSLSHELDRIESYVEQALYYARSTAVEKDYAIKQVNLERVIKEAVKKQARSLIEKGIIPQFKNVDQNVFADPKWLDFIIGQIIANSVKYSRPRSEEHTPKIAFIAECLDDSFETRIVRLQIKDNGIGIPSADIGRVFEKGFTGENGRSFAKSTGIGLYLCKSLCDKMKLGLSIESYAVGEALGGKELGTTLTIEFSLSKMHFLE